MEFLSGVLFRVQGLGVIRLEAEKSLLRNSNQYNPATEASIPKPQSRGQGMQPTSVDNARASSETS